MYGEPSQSFAAVARHSLPSTQKGTGAGVGAGVVVGIAVVDEDVTAARAVVVEVEKGSGEVEAVACVEDVVGNRVLVEDARALEVDDTTAVDDEGSGAGVVVVAFELAPAVVLVDGLEGAADVALGVLTGLPVVARVDDAALVGGDPQ